MWSSNATAEDILPEWGGPYCYTISGEGGGGCCDLRGDLDGSGEINVADLTFMVDYLFAAGPQPVCVEEGDIDASGAIDVSDLTQLVDYLFGGGLAPTPCP